MALRVLERLGSSKPCNHAGALPALNIAAAFSPTRFLALVL